MPEVAGRITQETSHLSNRLKLGCAAGIGSAQEARRCSMDQLILKRAEEEHRLGTGPRDAN